MQTKSASALAVTALFALTALLPSVGAIIAPPPPDLKPGWGPVSALDVNWRGYLTSYAARSDGSFGLVGTYDQDSVTNKYNATLMSRGTNYWYPQWLRGGIDYIAPPFVAVTDHPDRAGVYAYAYQQGTLLAAAASFVNEGGVAGPLVRFTHSDTLDWMEIAASPAGNVMGVYAEDNTSLRLWANHSGPLSGWDGAVMVANMTRSFDFKVAAIGDDDFVLVWAQQDSAGTALMGARYRSGIGWDAPQQIAPFFTTLYSLTIASSAGAGRGAVAVHSMDAPLSNITVVPFNESAGFLPSQVVFSAADPYHSLTPPSIAVDGTGTVHLAYAEGPIAQSAVNLTYRRLDAQGQWSTPSLWELEALPATLRLSAAADGHLAMGWRIPAAFVDAITVMRFVAGSGWRAPERVDVEFTPTHRSGTPYLAVEDRGNLTVLFPSREIYGEILATRSFVAGNDPPVITITAPAAGSSVIEPTVLVSGTVDPVSRVSVNGVAATVADDGSFSARVALNPGTHTIEVYAVDEWGNSGSASVTVTFNDPLAAVLAGTQAELAATQAELDLTVEELNDTADKYGQVKVQFGWMESNATAAEANATLFKGELMGLQADYDAAQARVAFLESQQNATNSVVQNTTSQNAALAGQVAVLSIVAFASLIAGVGAMAVTLIQSKRGGGGGEGKKVEVRGWDPETKKEVTGTAGAQGADAKEPSPAQEQLKGNPRH